jgi:transcriptional regulator with XRE-family HTH domain
MDKEKKDIVLKLGSNIRMIRVEKNYSMEKLALESEMEYSQIRRIEKGVINTTVYQIYRISKTLEIPMVEIFHDM